jgi:hypothetical protein
MAGGILWILYSEVCAAFSISYGGLRDHRVVTTLSDDDARRIGAELKRWSERPVRATNVRAAWLCAILVAIVLVAAQQAPEAAAAVRSLSAMFVVMMASLHFMAKGILRGLLRAGVAEAQDALVSLQDPRRVSGFDMAVFWVAIALAAGCFGQ